MDKDAKQQMLMDENLSDERKMQILANRKRMGGIIKKDEPFYKNAIRISIFLLVIPFIIISELYDAIKTNGPQIWNSFITLITNVIQQIKEIAFKLYNVIRFIWQNKKIVKDLYLIIANYFRILCYKVYEKLLLFVNLRLFVYNFIFRLNLRARLFLKNTVRLIQNSCEFLINYLAKVFIKFKQFATKSTQFFYNRINQVINILIKIYQIIHNYLIDAKDSGKKLCKYISKILNPFIQIIKNLTLIVYLQIKLQITRFFIKSLSISKQIFQYLQQKVIQLINLIKLLIIAIKNQFILVQKKIYQIYKITIKFILNNLLRTQIFVKNTIIQIQNFIINCIWNPFYKFIIYLQSKCIQIIHSFINNVTRIYHLLIKQIIEIIQIIKSILINQCNKLKNYLINKIVNPIQIICLKLYQNTLNLFNAIYYKIVQIIKFQIIRINKLINLLIDKIKLALNFCFNKLKYYGNSILKVIKNSIINSIKKLNEFFNFLKLRVIIIGESSTKFINQIIERLKSQQNPFKLYFKKYLKPLLHSLFDKLTKGALVMLEQSYYFIHQVIYPLGKKIKRRFIKLSLKLLNILELILIQLNDTIPIFILWLYDWIEFILYQVYRLIHFIIIRPLLWIFKIILTITEYSLEKFQSVAKKTKFLLKKFYFEIKEIIIKSLTFCKNAIKFFHQYYFKPLMTSIVKFIIKTSRILRAYFSKLRVILKEQLIHIYKLCQLFLQQFYQQRIKPFCIQLLISFKYQFRAFKNFIKLTIRFIKTQSKLIKLQSRILIFQMKSLFSIYYNNTIKPILIQTKIVIIAMKNQTISLAKQILQKTKNEFKIMFNSMRAVARNYWIEIKILTIKSAIQSIKVNFSILKIQIKQGSKQAIQICKQNIQVAKEYATQIEQYFQQQFKLIREYVNQQWQPIKESIRIQKNLIFENINYYKANIKEIVQNLKNQSRNSRFQVRDELKQQKQDLKIKKQEVKQDLRTYKYEVLQQLKTK